MAKNNTPSNADIRRWHKEREEAEGKVSYCTTFCNQAHLLKNGHPVGHECYVLDPKKLSDEAFGYEIEGSIVKEPRRVVDDREESDEAIVLADK